MEFNYENNENKNKNISLKIRKYLDDQGENEEIQSEQISKNYNIFEKINKNKNNFSLQRENPFQLKNQKNEIFLEEEIFRVKKILENLKKTKQQNNQIQSLLSEKYENLNEKQNSHEKILEKIKRINKSKQKKHIKYVKYTPLNKVYYYCPKKIHYYYILMDLVIKSRKKNKLGNNNFHFSLGGNNSNIPKKKEINRFKFNKKEDNIIKKYLILMSFNIQNNTNNNNNSLTINWIQIANEIKNLYNNNSNNNSLNNIQSNNVNNPAAKNAFQVFVRSLEISNFYAYKKWTNLEDNILRKAILYYGPKNWQQISYCLDGRNNSQCFHRWMKGINPKIKRDKWSFEEDLTLGVALKIYGNKKWSKIANHLTGRTDIQCRERFCNILDPNLEEVEWKGTEDIKLLSLYEKFGKKWSKIAKEFGNRTDNTCWRRWKYLVSVKSFENNNRNINFKSKENKEIKKGRNSERNDDDIGNDYNNNNLKNISKERNELNDNGSKKIKNFNDDKNNENKGNAIFNKIFESKNTEKELNTNNINNNNNREENIFLKKKIKRDERKLKKNNYSKNNIDNSDKEKLKEQAKGKIQKNENSNFKEPKDFSNDIINKKDHLFLFDSKNSNPNNLVIRKIQNQKKGNEIFKIVKMK